MQPINYQPLAKMEQVKFGGQTIDWSQPKVQIFKNLPTADKIVVILLVIIALASAPFLGYFGILLLLGVPSYFLAKRLKNQEALLWQAFAVANGWQMLPPLQASAFVPPSLTSTGHSQKCSDAIVGAINQLPIKLFNYQYTTGSGKTSQTFSTTVLVLQMDKVDLPNILLTPTKGLAVGPNSDLSEKLKLEGDFNKFFKVFTEKGDEVDELSILTPDIMQFLINSDQSYGIETYPLGIAVYSHGDARQIDKLPPLVDFSMKFYQQVMQNLPKARLAQNQSVGSVAKEG